MNKWIFYCVISWILGSVIFYFSYFTVNLKLGPNEHLIIINKKVIEEYKEIEKLIEEQEIIIRFEEYKNKNYRIYLENINNYLLYFLVMFYLFINTIIRNINTDYIKPWIILNLQNKNVSLDISNTYSYNIIIISTLYVYFDWYLSLVLIFTQLDIVLSSIVMEILLQIVMCRFYLKKKCLNVNLNAGDLILI